MPIKTVEVGIVPASVKDYLASLDKISADYHFVNGKPGFKALTLELWVEGTEDSLRITLCPDGTWSATAHLEVSRSED